MSEPSTTKQVKQWIGLAILLLLLIVVFQNTASVTTQVLWMEFTLPRSLWLFLMLAVGFAVGLVIGHVKGSRKRREAPPPPPATAD